MVMTNDLISSTFSLSRGVRQGSSISPLLYVIAMEPLAIAIRSLPSIKGIEVGGVTHHGALFAEDVILFLGDVDKSIPPLLQMIKQYGEFSGFKVNTEKSMIMFLKEQERDVPPVPHPFINAKEGFTYLGIKITPSIRLISASNYVPTLNKISEDIARWTSLPLSIIGRVNIIKMNILVMELGDTEMEK